MRSLSIMAGALLMFLSLGSEIGSQGVVPGTPKEMGEFCRALAKKIRQGDAKDRMQAIHNTIALAQGIQSPIVSELQWSLRQDSDPEVRALAASALWARSVLPSENPLD